MPGPSKDILHHTQIHAPIKRVKTWISYYKSSSVCLFVCLSVCSLSPPRSFDRSSPNLVGVCRWTSELPLRGSFSKRSTARRVNGSLSLSTILYMCQPHSTQLQKATLLLLHLIRLKGTFCCIDGWWVYVGGSRNWLLDGSSMACKKERAEKEMNVIFLYFWFIHKYLYYYYHCYYHNWHYYYDSYPVSPFCFAF